MLHFGRFAIGQRQPEGCLQCARDAGRAADLGRNRSWKPLDDQAPGIRVERLDRAAQHYVGEGIEIELGRQRLAQASDRALQTCPLVRDEVQATLRLSDARRALARQQQEDCVDRKQEQDLERVLARGIYHQ